MSELLTINKKTTTHCGIAQEALKRAIYAHCCGKYETEVSTFDEKQIVPEWLPVWEAFQRYDLDLNRFMSEKGYDLIEDENLRVEVMMTVFRCLDHHPLSPFMTDWLNGYLDFFERESRSNGYGGTPSSLFLFD